MWTIEDNTVSRAHSMPSRFVLCENIAENSAFPYKAAVDLQRLMFSWFQSGLNMDRVCTPCCKVWPVDEKQAYVDSTQLNNSNKLSRVNYADKQIKKQLQCWLNPGWNVCYLFEHFELVLHLISGHCYGFSVDFKYRNHLGVLTFPAYLNNTVTIIVIRNVHSVTSVF